MKRGKEIAVGDVVYVPHRAFSWIKVAEVRHGVRRHNRDAVWLLPTNDRRWVWLRANKSYVVENPTEGRTT